MPAWVAEMDFPPAPCISAAVAACLDRGDLGYPPFQAASGVPQAFAERAEALWGWSVDPALVHVLPNVMSGLHHAIRVFTAPGDRVVVTTPVYHPFLSVVPHAGRELVSVPLLDEGQLDLDRLRQEFRAGARMLLLCHPHNPTGHVLTRDELEGLASIILDHDGWLVSDEVHAGLTYPPARHVPAAAVDPELADRTITVTSASKAFNIPGLRCAVASSGNADVHERLGLDADMTLHIVGTLGIAATLAAWTPEGDEWLEVCRQRLLVNRAHLGQRLRDELPDVAWLLAAGHLSGVARSPRRRARRRPCEVAPAPRAVALSPGYEFGAPGVGFARLNFATTTDILDLVVTRIVEAVRAR